MQSDEIFRLVLSYVLQEGFKLEMRGKSTLLLLGEKVIYSWENYGYSHLELILAMYGYLVEPPLFYH